MNTALSNSPGTDGWHVARGTGEPEPPPYQVLARAEWPGLELLVCREDIRTLTHWAIQQPRHTVIVHLGGSMRSLSTEIEHAGACHSPPSPGDIWVIPAGRRYLSEAKGHVIAYAELRVIPEALVDHPSRPGPLGDLAARMGHRDEFFFHTVARLARNAGSGDDLEQMMGDTLQRLIRMHLYRDYRFAPAMSLSSSRPSSSRLGNAEARRLSGYIEEQLAMRITLADLAGLVDRSIHQLLVAFRTSFGTTPAQYVLDRRLARSRWLLLNTNQDISDIAMATGFSSHSHFSAAFRRREGVTPGQFRGTRRTIKLP